MKKITALLILLCIGLAGFSQRLYFVYLQSEGAQPFFLKMNEQVYSSNASGYLILSKLEDSTYTFSIGFPQNKWPEQVFAVRVGGKDKGFLLKNTSDNSWGLVDLQTEQQINGQASVKQRSVKIEQKEVSAFTDVLSKAANDPSLKQRVVPVAQPVVKTEEKPVAAPVVAKIETPPTAVAAAEKPSEDQKPAGNVTKDPAALASGSPAQEPQVKPDSTERKTETASVIVPVREPVIKHDTIQKKEETVAITPGRDTVAGTDSSVSEKKAPVTAEVKKEESVKQEATPQQTSVDTLAQIQSSNKKEEQPSEVQTAVYTPSKVKRRTESSTTEGFGVTYIDEYADGKKDTIQIMIPNPKQVVRNVPPPQEDGQFLPMDSDAKDLTPGKKETTGGTKNNCTSMASETDYLKLRRKMVATDGDDAMLAAAKKIFKTKCFTTEQVRNLGTLFLNDAGRYNFFDAAYLSVSDRENFAALEGEIKDAYYVSRFKAMLR
ncbi:MAG: hypothetical protein DI535_24980 [Citrobacter freundii]|nr:MAG: hypothetical protein DI535_24980 [Citrobacter freundii]